MKRTLLLLLALVAFSSCSLDDDGPNTLHSYAPITAVELPEAFVLGEQYDLKITYQNPSPCHKWLGFEYIPQDELHYFGIVTFFNPQDPQCTDEAGTTEEYLWKFTANKNEKYIFKFWTGTDSQGAPVYLTKEVRVLE